LVAYRRGVKRPQFLAGVLRFFGILVVTLSSFGIVAGVTGDGGGDVTYSVASLFSGLLLLAISAVLDWCAILLLTLRYGTKAEE
jgi:hypothetical protein